MKPQFHRSRFGARVATTRTAGCAATVAPLGGPASVPATPEYAYQYDDIGNRITSTDLTTNRTYTANSLNQYTLISNLCDSASLREEFVPQFDDDGNQTLIKTVTGVWRVTYNGENRPVRWSSGNVSFSMAYDRMGRRVEISRFKEQSLVLKQVFLYDGYQQIGRKIQDYESLNLVKEEQFIWDPTEPVATRPLVWNRSDATSYYIFDGKKNVSEVVSEGGDIVAHYEYAPFGTLSSASGDSAYLNPWRFSSEYADDGTATVYYNYRNYEPICGRWMGKDPLDEQWSVNLYSFCQNDAEYYLDAYGLWSVDFSWTFKDIPLPLPFAPNWYLVIGNKISGQMGSCCSCTKGRTIYLQAKWTPSLAVRYGYKDKLGLGKDGRLLRKDKNGRWHNFDNNQFSRQPVPSVSDMYDELVDAVLGKGRISFEADEEKEKCCPKEGVSGELRGFLRGQISAWGYGSAFDITWVIYPNGSWSPKTDDARFGRVGGGTQFYADAGIEGDVKLSHVVE